MERRRIVRYEFVMNSEEFEIFNIMCDSDKYAYGYRIEGNWRNGNEKYYVTMDENTLYKVKRALETYIGEINFDYECKVREISREEWEFYDEVKELLDNITDEENEEEW